MGETIYGFEILSKRELPEFNGVGIFAKHKKTGLELYHILNKDNENLFSYNFMTHAMDSLGTAHVLEHTTLCGSEHYPLRDPFMVLEKQSVNSFLNAMTYPDKTCYPASSVVEADYFNLMSVYGDAVFFPKLEKWAFEQEGHRFEINEQDRIQLKGVVLNEMRANYSDFDSVVYDSAIASIFEGSIYEYDSGGHPLEIPNLKYEDYKAFHKKFYHPINCRIFLMGNIPTEKQLKLLDEKFLSKFDAEEPAELIPPIKIYDEPRYYSKTAPANENEETDKNTIVMSWLLPESFNTEKLLQAYLIAELLLGHTAAYLNKILLDEKVCDSLYPYNGISKSMRNMLFILGIKGSDISVKEFEKLIFDSLNDLLKNGIEQSAIDSAIHAIEFANKEIRRDEAPFSLTIMERAMSAWVHGLNPETALEYIPTFEKIKKDLAEDSNYIQNLIKEFLTENKHYAITEVEPDKKFSEKIDEQLHAKSREFSKTLSEEDRKEMLKKQERCNERKQEPETPENLELIPHLSKKDLPPLPKPAQEELNIISGVPVVAYEQPTNGIGYFNLLLPVDSIAKEDYKYLPLLSLCVASMGTHKKTWSETTAKIASLFGGFSVSCNVISASEFTDFPIFNQDKNFTAEQVVGRDWLIINGKMLGDLIPEAIEFLFEFIRDSSFDDKKRLLYLIKQRRNNYETLPALDGNSLAMLKACAPFSDKAALRERMSGITQLRFLREVEKESDLDFLIEKFTKMYKQILDSGLVVGITGTSKNISSFKKVLAKNLQGFKAPNKKTPYSFENEFTFAPNEKNRLALIPAALQVGFSVSVFQGAKFGTKDLSIQALLCRRLSNGPMWDKIRNIGGAYGAYAISQALQGNLILLSYRDPNPIKSLNEFLNSLEEIANTPADEKSMEPLIIGRYGKELTPQTPAMRAANRFRNIFSATPFEMRQEFVHNMLDITAKDLQDYAKKLLEQKHSLSSVVLSSEIDLELRNTVSDFLPNQIMMEKI